MIHVWVRVRPGQRGSITVQDEKPLGLMFYSDGLFLAHRFERVDAGWSSHQLRCHKGFWEQREAQMLTNRRLISRDRRRYLLQLGSG